MFRNNTIITISIMTALIISIILIPMSGFAGTISQIDNISQSEIQLETEEEELQYEREADSWRYQKGYILQEDSPTAFKGRAVFTPWSKLNDNFINSNGEVIEGAVRKGIDVSAWQGDIDWDKVKASGIDFAIIRCGYGSNDRSQDDSKWERNVSECERLGIPYGVYLYSYANTIEKAKSEAAHVLRLLKGHTPSYPVYYDLEDKIVSNAGRTAIINYANIFCSSIEANGYRAGIYANLSWWDTKLNDNSLNKYEKWVAQWYHTCTYGGDYRLWQCTSDGSVSGISGRVDLNFEFWKPDTIVDVEDYYIIINAEYKNCRLGPHTSYSIESKVYKGDMKKVTHEAGNWAKLEEGIWINLYGTAKYIDVKDYDIFINAEYKNYREGPGTDYDVVGKINKGNEITITHECEGWGKITDGKWINLYDTKKIDDIDDYDIFINAEYKNYREGPGTDYDVLGKINKGKEVTITHECEGWGKITDGKWINLYNTKKIDDIDDYDIFINAEYKNYREGPGTDYDVVGKINKYGVVGISHACENWGKVANSKWINLSNSMKIERVIDYNVRIDAEYKNCRKGPGMDYEIEAQIFQNTEIEITHKSGNWGRLTDGTWINLANTTKM